jgi:hypothetical protein
MHACKVKHGQEGNLKVHALLFTVNARHMNLHSVDGAKLLAAQLAQVVSGKMFVFQMVYNVILSCAHLPTHGTVKLS